MECDNSNKVTIGQHCNAHLLRAIDEEVRERTRARPPDTDDSMLAHGNCTRSNITMHDTWYGNMTLENRARQSTLYQTTARIYHCAPNHNEHCWRRYSLLTNIHTANPWVRCVAHVFQPHICRGATGKGFIRR